MVPKSSLLRRTSRSADDRPCAVDTDYWLARSDGFCAVDGDGHRLGIVTELRYEGRIDRPAALIVRGGILRSRERIIATEQVKAVYPHRREIVVEAAAQTASTPGVVAAPPARSA